MGISAFTPFSYSRAHDLLLSICGEHEQGDEEKIECIYVSLYGVSDIAQIKEKLAYFFWSKWLSKQPKVHKYKADKRFDIVSKVTAGAAELVAEKFGVKNVVTGTFEYISEYMREHGEYLYVFDDLERCDIDINQVLGYINEIVEQQNSRVLLVGNEKEFAAHKQSENLHGKYDVALNSNIDWEENTGSASGKLTLGQIQGKADKLFPKDSSYKLTKEKVIGLTVKYQSNLSECYDSLCDSKFKENKDHLVQLKECAMNVFENHGCENLRILLSGLQAYLRIYDVVKKNTIGENDEIVFDVCERFLQSTLSLNIVLKTNGKIPTWENENQLYQYVFYGSVWDSKSSGEAYQFIDKYLESGHMDEHMGKMTVKKVIDVIN